MDIEIRRTNNFWIDNGIVVLGIWLLNLGFESNVELHPTKLIVKNVEFENVSNKLRENYLKERKKRFLNPFIRQYTTGDPWVEKIFVEKTNTICCFCERLTLESRHLKLNRAIFPFSNIRFPAFISNRNTFAYVCPFCYIFGRLGAFNVFFSLKGLTYFYFIPFSYNLQVLSEIEPLLEKAEERSNYTNYLAKRGDQYTHTDQFFEELLAVLYYCFLKLNAYGKEDVFKKINAFYCFRYEGMLTTEFFKFEKVNSMYDFFSQMTSKISSEALRFIYDYFRNEENKYLRNEFCKHTLEFSSVIHDITEIFFIKVKHNMYYHFPVNLDVFLRIYYCDVMKMMNEDIKNMCKEVGEGIGVFTSGSYEEGKERKDILYSLRNSDTLQKFVNVLNSVMIEGFSVTKRETMQKLLDSLDKRNWEITKEFILAYALNKYLGIKYAQKVGGEKK